MAFTQMIEYNLEKLYPSSLQEMEGNIPYQSTMVLGRTYDLRNNKSGRDIFPETCISNQQTTETPKLTIKYQVIKSFSDVKSLLGVSGDISLKVKAGILKVQGFGSYLSENRSEENMLEIMAVAHAETVSTTLMNPHPYDDWKTNPQGTHYIRTIFYGGDLIISIRIVASNSKHLEEIKAKVNSKLKVTGFIDAEAKANFTNIEQDLKESSKIYFSYYCTARCTEIPKDVESMMKALDDFQNQLKTVNEGKGSPLSCELVPLTHFDRDFPTISCDTYPESDLRDLEEFYDDILQAKSMLRTKLGAVTSMTQEEREIGDELEKRIDDVKSYFNKVISALNVTTTVDHIKQAFHYYHKNRKFGGFRAEVKKFFKDDQPLISTGTSGTPVKDLPPGDPLSIILVGITGHGKSATANSIFGNYKFETRMGCESVSTSCQMENGKIGGREICLVDTPGSIYSKSNSDVANTLGTAITCRPEGFHAFLFVFSIDARIREEDKYAIKVLKKKFGDGILAKCGVFIFTHGDSFKRNMKKIKRDTTFFEHITSQGGYIETVLKECSYRCALIDNMEDDSGILREQVIHIITLIDTLVKNNGGQPYTWCSLNK